MDIVVLENVSKRFGFKVALDGISVSFKEGRITGFLGLNGAGKTTTMKIITSYFKPDSGKVYVNSIDVLENPYEVRKVIGYLPENFPIYDNLTVIDFLRFVALAKDIPDVDNEVNEVIKAVGIENYRNSFLKELSKGYKQRVGIAQAIIGNPKLIILDEPTQGLDPAQIVEIRNLIKSLSEKRTIILSTHIMQEVDAICDEVVIIHEGKIKISGPISKLKENIKDYINVEYIYDKVLISDNIKNKIESILKNYINTFPTIEISSVKFSIPKKEEFKMEKINKELIENGLLFKYVNREFVTMEDLFLKIINDEY